MQSDGYNHTLHSQFQYDYQKPLITTLSKGLQTFWTKRERNTCVNINCQECSHSIAIDISVVGAKNLLQREIKEAVNLVELS